MSKQEQQQTGENKGGSKPKNRVIEKDGEIWLEVAEHIDRGVLAILGSRRLEHNMPLRESMGEEGVKKFGQYLDQFLRGGHLSIEALQKDNTYLAILKRIAKTSIAEICLKDGEAPFFAPTNCSVYAFGTNPHTFLADGSGRNGLGSP